MRIPNWVRAAGVSGCHRFKGFTALGNFADFRLRGAQVHLGFRVRVWGLGFIGFRVWGFGFRETALRAVLMAWRSHIPRCNAGV